MHNLISSLIPKRNLMDLQIRICRCHQPLLAIYSHNKIGYRTVTRVAVSNLVIRKQWMFSTFNRMYGSQDENVTSNIKTVLKEKADENLALLNYEAVPNRDRIVFSREQQDELMKKGMATWYFKNYVTGMQLYNNGQNAASSNKMEKINCLRLPGIDYKFDMKSSIWSARLTVFHPEEKIFNAVGMKKKDVENQLCFEAIYWLRHRRCLNHALMPIFENKKEIPNSTKDLTVPLEIPALNSSHRSELLQYLNHFDENYSPLLKLGGNISNLSETLPIDADEDQFDLNRSDHHMEEFDPAHAKPPISQIVRDFKENELTRRSEQLSEHLKRRCSRWDTKSHYRELRDRVASLPINNSRQEILQTIRNNQVTVISGETGSGKTTQVPLMILEQFIEEGRGAFASILVTQPRRLAAISIAEQVAFQFDESRCGDSVGYHVRFEKKLPQYDNGAILFCTTGILLSKLVNNPNLEQVSHVIIDEIHERDVTSDLLLIFIRRLIKTNCNIKIVLMSASMNAKKFSDYFDNAPCINISGRCFPVEMFYLEEFATKLPSGSSFKNYNEQHRNYSLTPTINAIQIAELVEYIDRSVNDDGLGSILIFLPGWNEIKETRQALNCISQPRNRLQIIPCHSNLPSSEQKLIFTKPQMGLRKVVLSTNIAETSLTVPDVVYVIDSGLHKEMRYHKKKNVATFGTYFISQANAIQRTGRAGRVAAGQCFRLYTKEQFEQFMDTYPTPEIQRIPLESVVIKTKLYSPIESVVNVLQEALTPPETSVIQHSLESMKACNVIDENENLTSLGQRIVLFPLHPRLSVSLVAASMFGVLDPVLNIAAVLSAPRSLFDIGIDDRPELRWIKETFAGDSRSDHVAFARLIEALEKECTTDGNIQEFIDSNMLHYNCSETVLHLKRLYESNLKDSKLVSEFDIHDSKSICNRHKNEPTLILAAVLVGLYPNLIKKIRGKICGTKMMGTKKSMIDIQTHHPAKLPTESIARETYQDDTTKQEFMIYFSAHLSEASKQFTPKDVSVISPLSLLLFAGKNIVKADQNLDSSWKNVEDMNLNSADRVVFKIDNQVDLKFSALEDDLNVLIRWKDLIRQLFAWWVTRDIKNPTKFDEDMDEELRKCFDLTLRILNDKGR